MRTTGDMDLYGEKMEKGLERENVMKTHMERESIELLYAM